MSNGGSAAETPLSWLLGIIFSVSINVYGFIEVELDSHLQELIASDAWPKNEADMHISVLEQ